MNDTLLIPDLIHEPAPPPTPAQEIASVIAASILADRRKAVAPDGSIQLLPAPLVDHLASAGVPLATIDEARRLLGFRILMMPNSACWIGNVESLTAPADSAPKKKPRDPARPAPDDPELIPHALAAARTLLKIGGDAQQIILPGSVVKPAMATAGVPIGWFGPAMKAAGAVFDTEASTWTADADALRAFLEGGVK